MDNKTMKAVLKQRDKLMKDSLISRSKADTFMISDLKRQMNNE